MIKANIGAPVFRAVRISGVVAILLEHRRARKGEYYLCKLQSTMGGFVRARLEGFNAPRKYVAALGLGQKVRKCMRAAKSIL